MSKRSTLIFIYCFSFLFSYSQTNVSGTISKDSTWSLAGSPYTLTGAVTVSAGNTLTIDPGVEVKFSSYVYRLLIDGTLIANGTIVDSVRFTGAGAQGGQVRFNSSSTGNSLDYVRMTNMGSGTYSALQVESGSTSITHSYFQKSYYGVDINNASPTIQNVLIENPTSYGIVIDGGSPTISAITIDGKGSGTGIQINSGTPDIQTSIIKNNTNGIYVSSTDVPIITGNTFSGNSKDLIANPELLDDANFDNNGLSIVYIRATNITASTTWHKPTEGWTYRLDGGVTVNNGVTLTIEPGVTLRFISYTYRLLVDGTLIANGTAVDSIYFIGQPGGQLRLNSGSSGNSLDYVRMTNMGSGTYSALQVESSGTTIQRSYFQNSYYGVDINNASPTIQNVLIENPTNYGIVIDGGSPTISSSTIDGTALAGILINSGVADIQNNTIKNVGSTAGRAGIVIATNKLSIVQNNTFSGNYWDVFAHPEVLDSIDLDNNGLTEVVVYNANINRKTTWHKHNWNYQLYYDLDVNDTLAVEPGVEIGFMNQNTDLIVNGRLDAKGSSGDSIRFYGSNASANIHGGSIILAAGSSNVIAFAKIDKMGDTSGTYDAAVYMNNSSDSITNSLIYDSEYYGIRVANGASPYISTNTIQSNANYAVYVESGSPQLLNNQIIFNNAGIYLADANSTVISNNTISNTTNDGLLVNNPIAFTLSSNTFSNNFRDASVHPSSVDITDYSLTGLNDLHFVSNSSTSKNTTWQDYGFPYILPADVTVLNGHTLTIEAGTRIGFSSTIADLLVNGTLIAQGSKTDSIYFYGNSTNPSTYGGSIELLSASSGSILKYVDIHKLGDASAVYDAAIFLETANATISNLKIQQIERYGVRVDNNASPTLDSVLIDSTYYGIYTLSGSPVITNSAITHSSQYGALNSGAGIVFATGNFWGHSSGPYHPSTNSSGTGGRVSDNVSYNPWLTTHPYVANLSPVVDNPIADRVLAEDFAKLFIAVLTNVFSDPESTALTFSASSYALADTTKTGVTTLISNDSLYLLANADFYGAVKVTVTATDISSAQTSDIFDLVISPVEDPPVLSGIPDTDFTVNDSVTIDLATYTIDVDELDDITYSSQILSGSGLTVAINGSMAKLKSSTVAAFQLEFTATDGNNTTDKDTITVTVNVDNAAPIVSAPITDRGFNEDFAKTFLIKLTDVFSDPDLDQLSFAAQVINAGVAVSISNDSLYASGNLNFNGTATVRVTATDPGLLAVADTFDIVISPVNDIPVTFAITSPADGTITGNQNPTFSWQASSDIDGDAIQYVLQVSTTNTFTTIAYTEATNNTSLTIAGTLIDGSYFWRVKATDGHGGERISSNFFALSIDDTGPDLSIGVLTSTVIKSELSIYLSSLEQLTGAVNASIVLKDGSNATVDSQNKAMSILSGHQYLYHTTYSLSQIGTLELSISGSDAYGNTTVENRNLSIATITKQAGQLVAAKGRIQINLPADQYRSSSYLLAGEIESIKNTFNSSDLKAIGSEFEVIAESGLGEMQIRLNYSDAELNELRSRTSNFDERKIGLYHYRNERWEFVGGEGKSNSVITTSEDGGRFAVFYDENHVFFPEKIELAQNYPNPFNPSTTIRFGVPEKQQVRVIVFNLLGQKIKTLINKTLPAGYHDAVWDGRNEQGQAVSSGIYLYQIQSGNHAVSKRMVLIK
ncbi:MAG: right-handed parallel beta-helix repeat-containing protein [Calditrichaeota bacterium]|nr:right-handed parallel beta-helix repeat-containing protein [Calditrichota bacterium]